MKRVLFWVLLLATVAGALAAAGMNRETVDPFLRSWGIEPDSAWFKEALRFAFAIVVVGPLVALLWALFALGSDEAGQDIHGYTVLRLKPGMRITLSVLAVALAVLMIAGTLDTEQEALKWLFRAFAVAFLWCGWVIFTAKVRFDGATLFAPAPWAASENTTGLIWSPSKPCPTTANTGWCSATSAR